MDNFFAPRVASAKSGQYALLLMVQIVETAGTLQLQPPSSSSIVHDVPEKFTIASTSGQSAIVQYFNPLCAAASAILPLCAKVAVVLEAVEKLDIAYSIAPPAAIRKTTVTRIKAPVCR
ncbi:MAG: hypothetical protein WC091_04150 [Sulfuricellaceae bacterium]